MKAASRPIASLLLAGAFAAQAGAEVEQTAGTTVIGEREAAVGLYLTPWREEAASDIDRAPRLYEPGSEAIDGTDLVRQVETRESMEAYWRLRLLRR